MSEYVEKYTCGSCREFEYKGRNTKGYCNWYGAYYYPDDSCSHWKQSDSVSSSSGGCYLTTACVGHKGLADNCYELETLRKFRDGYMAALPQGKADIQEYYEKAPIIVEAIDMSADKETEYESIYADVIKPCVEMIDNGNNEGAYKLYKDMVRRLEKKYCY